VPAWALPQKGGVCFLSQRSLIRPALSRIFNQDSVVQLKRLEARCDPWSSEGVRLCSFKVFWGSRKLLRSSSTSTRSTADRCLSEAQPNRLGCGRVAPSRFLSAATAESGFNLSLISGTALGNFFFETRKDRFEESILD
jgi:hypothetical protein